MSRRQVWVIRWLGGGRAEARPRSGLISAWVWVPTLVLISAGVLKGLSERFGDHVRQVADHAGLVLVGLLLLLAVKWGRGLGGRQ